MARCRPHVWNVEAWLPLYRSADIDADMECLNCGRVLSVKDTTPNMQLSITRSIASRLFDGDEYSEVYDAVSAYFRHHLGIGY